MAGIHNYFLEWYKGTNFVKDILFKCLLSIVRSIIYQPYPNNESKKMELHWHSCDQNTNQPLIMWTQWKLQLLHNDGLHSGAEL